MAGFLDKTVFDLSISKASQLIAESSYVGISKEGSAAIFDKFELKLEAGKITSRLFLTIEGQSVKIDNPQFKFDFKNSKVFVEDYTFHFFEQKDVDFCSLKASLTSE